MIDRNSPYRFLHGQPLNTSPAGHWLIGGPLGQALCKLVVYLPMVSYSVSSQSLVLIAVDRFVAVMFPLRSPVISCKVLPFVITATWIIALAFYFPFFNVVKVVEFNGDSICSTFSGEITSWHIAAPIINYIIIVITIVLLVILYSIIVIKLKLQACPGEQSNNAEKKRARRNRKVLRMACARRCWTRSERHHGEKIKNGSFVSDLRSVHISCYAIKIPGEIV